MSTGAAILRRLACIAAPGHPADAVRGWLTALPSGGVWHGELADAPLDQLEVLWVAAGSVTGDHLPAWLRAGGRLLLTGPGTRLATALGLERVSPTPFSDRPAVPRAVAGFGAHPLFAGLSDGATLGNPGTEAFGYEGSRPAGAVVAVERDGFVLRAERALAWEHAVGRGGVLCLGVEPALAAADPTHRREAEIVLANALVGEAVPHVDRGPAVCWPVRGGRAVIHRSTGGGLTAPPDAWPASTLPAFELGPSAPWTQAGRRLLVTGRSDGGREVWAPPVRVMASAGVRAAIPCAPLRLAADAMSGGLALGTHRLLERWAAAGDAPAVIWDIGGPAGVPVEVEWTVDLRRAWPYPEGAYGDLTASLDEARGCLGVSSAAGPEAAFAVSGATLVAEASPGAAAIRVRCVGTTPVRVVAAAGSSPGDLLRAAGALERDGAARLAAGRVRRAAQLHRYGTALEGPDDAVARAFDWARERGDEGLLGVPGVGRSLLASCPRDSEAPMWCFGTQACAPAAAQLLAGNREPAREVLRFLAQRQHPGGGIAAVHPLGGLASPPDAVATLAFLALVERYRAWTGDEDTLGRLRETVGRALAFLVTDAGGELVLPAALLDGLDELLGGSAAPVARRRAPGDDDVPLAARDPLAVLQAAAAALRRDPGPLPGPGAASALLAAAGELWGLAPNAPDDALSLAPMAPSPGDELALRRLRVGRSTLDLELRARGEAVALRVRHVHGPRLVVTATLRGARVGSVDVDDVPLAASRARFETRDRHEVRFHLL